MHDGSLATHERQAAGSVLLVRPASFGFNAQTAASNAFQTRGRRPRQAMRRPARQEFDALRAALRRGRCPLLRRRDTPAPPRPDAVFPNNWCSWHADGTLVLYPLLARNAGAPERREEIIAAVVRPPASASAGGSTYSRREHARPVPRRHRQPGARSRAAASPTPAARRAPTRRWCANGVRRWTTSRWCSMPATPAASPYYHTNVMLWIGTRCAHGLFRGHCASAARGRARAAGRGRELSSTSIAHAVAGIRRQHDRTAGARCRWQRPRRCC